jgi:putative DNA primase/helicase
VPLTVDEAREWLRKANDRRANDGMNGEEGEESPLAEEGESVGQLLVAERFVEDNADRLRYVHNVGWHEWDGGRWDLRQDGTETRAIIATVKGAASDPDDAELAKIGKATQRSVSGMEAILRTARALAPISTTHDRLDADPHLFNTPGGTCDLRTGEMRPHSQSDLITRVAGRGSGSDGAEWAAFLERVLPGSDVRSFVQRLIGYSMYGKVTEHVMPIFTGTGANGKGTFRDAIRAAFGDYADEADPELLMESKNDRHGAFKMKLRGKRLVFCSETERGRSFAEATMKRLVGGDPIEANYMRQNPITFDPSHTLIMLTNHLPTVSGDDPAIWRRILVVPFDIVIPLSEQDGELSSRLRAAAPEIIDWAFEGWRQYGQQGLNPPEAVRVRTAQYKSNSDSMARFLDDCTEPYDTVTVGARDLFAAWTKWCHETGESAGTETAFGNEMTRRGFVKRHTERGRRYVGITLRNGIEAEGLKGPEGFDTGF